jgi:hypothetical protein
MTKNYLIRKRAANARRPGTSQRAIAVSILALISPEAEGFRPIACIAPIPMSPIPIPDPITPMRAKAVYIIEKVKVNKTCAELGRRESIRFAILKIRKEGIALHF